MKLYLQNHMAWRLALLTAILVCVLAGFCSCALPTEADGGFDSSAESKEQQTIESAVHNPEPVSDGVVSAGVLKAMQRAGEGEQIEVRLRLKPVHEEYSVYQEQYITVEEVERYVLSELGFDVEEIEKKAAERGEQMDWGTKIDVQLRELGYNLTLEQWDTILLFRSLAGSYDAALADAAWYSYLDSLSIDTLGKTWGCMFSERESYVYREGGGYVYTSLTSAEIQALRATGLLRSLCLIHETVSSLDGVIADPDCSLEYWRKRIAGELPDWVGEPTMMLYADVTPEIPDAMTPDQLLAWYAELS